MAVSIAKNRKRIITVETMAQMEMLDGLLAEQLAHVAENAKLVRFVHDKEIDVSGHYFCFLMEGNLKLISAEVDSNSDEVHAGQLIPGMHFGSVWSQDTLTAKIRPLSTGSLAVLPSSFMRRIFIDWPEVMENYARITENGSHRLIEALLVDRAKLADTERVISRIEKVTDMLVSGGIGGNDIPQINQEKFVISKLPAQSGKKIEIEQGYLTPESGIEEDRIRRITGTEGIKYVRTRRITSDEGTRREFSDKLDSFGYEELKRRLSGNFIQKSRWTIPCEGSLEKLTKITVDSFSAPQRALNLMKNKYLLEISAENSEILKAINIKKELSLTGNLLNVTDNKEYSNKHLSV